MPLKITYAHHHQCKLKDEIYEDRPDSNGQIVWIRVPFCEETLMELNRIKVEKY